MYHNYIYILWNPPLKIYSGGSRREGIKENFENGRNHSIWSYYRFMFRRYHILIASWTRWNCFLLLVCAESLNSSDPEFHFSYGEAEGSTMKLSKQHGVSCHKRQFPAFTKQIFCRGTDVSVFPHELSQLFAFLLESKASCLICTSNTVL